jgi:hypothetical protein
MLFMFVLKGEGMRFRLPVVLEITRCGNIENKFLYFWFTCMLDS